MLLSYISLFFMHVVWMKMLHNWEYDMWITARIFLKISKRAIYILKLTDLAIIRIFHLVIIQKPSEKLTFRTPWYLHLHAKRYYLFGKFCERTKWMISWKNFPIFRCLYHWFGTGIWAQECFCNYSSQHTGDYNVKTCWKEWCNNKGNCRETLKIQS